MEFGQQAPDAVRRAVPNSHNRTSQDNRDALFIGFAGNLVVVCGWPRRHHIAGKITGGSTPAQIGAFHCPGADRRRRAGTPLPQSSNAAPPPLRAARKRRVRCLKLGAHTGLRDWCQLEQLIRTPAARNGASG